MAEPGEARPIRPPADDTRTAAESARMLAPGTVLAGRYRILEVAGAGGMGIVYKARDLDLDIDVAVKLIDSGRAADEMAVERFRRELLLSRQVTHPNVVRIHDISRDGELIFMTMDYREARSLRERLAEGPLEPAAAIEIARQVAGALAATHGEGVVHRDVKPANVLVDDDGHAWLCDFGIAQSSEHAPLTREGDIIGTLRYLAPEQVRGDPVDGRTDLYALGLVLWEMLTGEPLSSGRTGSETLAQRASGTLPPALGRTRQVPRGLRRILARCLAAAPADRYPDAEALIADFDRGRASFAVHRQLRRVAAAAAAAIAAGVAIWALWPASGPVPAVAETPPSIAVLPVVNLSGAGELDWVRRGLPAVIATQLAESAELSVVNNIRVARTLDDLHLDPARLESGDFRSLTDLFGVRYLVAGRVIGGGDDLRLQLELVAPAGERSHDLEVAVEPRGLAAGAERLVVQLLHELEVEAPSAPAPLPLSDDPAALEAFDHGVARIAGSEHTEAIAELLRAVELDDGFGLAWLRLADAYRAAGYAGEALDAVDRALALFGDADSRAVLWAQARRQELSGEPDRAVASFERLVARYPRDADARVALGELLIELGQLDRARSLLETVTRDDPQNPAAWFLLGKVAIIGGDAAAASDQYLVHALVIQNRLGNPEGRGEVLNALGIANERLGRLEQARDYYEQAASLRETAGDLRGASASLSNLARLQMIGGDHASAREALERALAVRREIGDLQGVANLLNELGVLEEEAGDYAAARDRYREALRLHETLGGGRGVAEAYTNLAFIYQVLGEYDNAEVFSERAQAAHRESGNNEWLMSTLLIDGELRLARGDWNAARAALVEAMEMSRELQSPYGEAAAQGGIGTLAWYQGRAGAALEAWARARAILEPIGDTRGLVEYRLRSAEMLLALDLYDAARAEIVEAQALLESGGSTAQTARLALALGCADAAAGRLDAAAAGIARAGELAKASGSPVLVLQADIGKLRCLGGDIASAGLLRDSAAAIGHRPYLLASLALLAEQQIEYGRIEDALATLRSALKPPLALDPWIGNWKLNGLLAEVAESSAGGDAAAAASTAAVLAQGIAQGLPDGLRGQFLARRDGN
jgi:eukaryotic-like serine/threonine-protein kinase